MAAPGMSMNLFLLFFHPYVHLSSISWFALYTFWSYVAFHPRLSHSSNHHAEAREVQVHAGKNLILHCHVS
jgi:hypothetical protein